ncbi:MAG: PmoA family protein [Chitinophagaceae bacterium]|nr:PmoA family protein [Chitinophagaceae bacterium]
MKIIIAVCLSVGLISTARAQSFTITENPEKKQIDISYHNKLLTSYCYYDSGRKPILFPVNTIDGITVTRGYPFAPRPGERTDHPHHSGIWLNYESVNGLDFWNNSTAIPFNKRNEYGTILHQKVVGKKADKDHAMLAIAASWIRPDHKTLINEQTTFIFTVKDSSFFIDRKTTLTGDTTVLFKDAKDGMMAIRVARELEMPSKEAGSFVDNKGNVTKMDSMDNSRVTGMYHSSEGINGDSVWSTRAKWVTLSGKKDGRDITIAMIDHPSNPGYPSYWHARGYGLFAINPLGQKIFSKGAQEMNLTLQKGQSVTFRYRIIIHSGKVLGDDQINNYASEFEKFK